MATYVKGDEVTKTTDGTAVTKNVSYELFEKVGEAYNSLSTAANINFEVSAMEFEPGDHTLVVKAKADGYEDSDYSNEVVYTAVEEGWVDITDQFVFTEGAMINANDGKYSTYSGWVATQDYIDLSAYSEIEIKMSKTSSTGTGSGNAFYDADKTYVSGITHTDGVATYGTMIKNIVLNSNMKYIRAMYWSKNNSNYKAEFGDFYCRAKLKS